jgi:hypothetical protein
MLDLEGPGAILEFSEAPHVFALEILEPVLREALVKNLVKQTGPSTPVV